ncbi:hypothetical protein FKM82_030164, partial [Ascaphus truei]
TKHTNPPSSPLTSCTQDTRTERVCVCAALLGLFCACSLIRELKDEELQKFCSRTAEFLQTQDLGSESSDSLRRLHLVIAASKYGRKLEQDFLEHLQTALCSQKSPDQIQTLCAAILREMPQCDHVALSCGDMQDTKLCSLLCSVLLAQV